MKTNPKRQISWITESTGKKYVLTTELYLHLKEEMHFKISLENHYYIFLQDHYCPISKKDLTTIIKNHIPLNLRSKGLVEKILWEMISDTPSVRDDDFNGNEDCILFKNGLLNLKTGKFRNATPNDLYIYQLPCKYREGALLTDAPVFMEYMNTLCNGEVETRTFLLEYMGAIFSNVKGYRFKKMLFLIGASHAGKTQLRELILNILGNENAISIDLKSLMSRFGTSSLFRKRLAGCGDLEKIALKDMAILKQLTGGDDLWAEVKGEPGFSFRYNGFLLFIGNHLPSLYGDRNAYIYDRMEIVTCNNVIPIEKRNPRICDEMLEEKEIIINVAIQYFKNAMERNYIFTESPSMKMNRLQYQSYGNSLFEFIRRYCSFDNGRVSRAYFNICYEDWCKQENLPVIPSSSREILILEAFGIKVQKSGVYNYPFSIHEDYIN